MERPLYPLRLFIYTPDGYHDEGVLILSEEQLHGPGTTLLIRAAVQSGVEVRITDPDDFLVFHARDSKILFPTQQQITEMGQQ